MSPLFDLWIPASDHCIAARSAVVSCHDQTGDQRLCYYEGNLYQSPILVRYADRVRCAASRATERYPTIARSSLPVSTLHHVGTYDARARRVITLTDPDALASFLSPEPLPIILTAEEARRRVETALRPFDPSPATCPAWDRLHAWTGRVSRESGTMLLECAAEQGDAVEWVEGPKYLPCNLIHGLRDLLDRET